MLWSQIKLTSYDFSDLHITGEFDNRPGTGRFLRIFSCVVTYRTGAGRRLYIKTLTDARPSIVRCRTVPVRFYTNFSRAVMITFISKFAIFPPKNRLLQKKDWGWLWQWWWWKPHLHKTAKISIALVGCRLIILSCSSNIYILYLCFGL